MSKRCEDCGCVKRSGICTNCNEELYIHDYQISDMDEPFKVSQEFKNRVNEQREKLENENNR